MNILSLLDLPSIVGKTVDKLVDRLIPDKNADAKTKRAIETLKSEMEKEFQDHIQKVTEGQVEINKIEAQHKSIFVAGWRPAIGWICALGLGYSYILQPILMWITVNFVKGVDTIPIIPVDNLYQLVLAMLGMGTLRTFEKVKKVNRNNMK